MGGNASKARPVSTHKTALNGITAYDCYNPISIPIESHIIGSNLSQIMIRDIREMSEYREIIIRCHFGSDSVINRMHSKF